MDKLNERLRKRAVAVAYGQAVEHPSIFGGMEKAMVRAWNAGGCCDFAVGNKKLDDVAYIEDMIDILTTKYPIDP